MRPVSTGLAATTAALLVLPVTSFYASNTHPATRGLHNQTAVPADWTRRLTRTVQAGDTLTSLAARLCGTPATWPGLYHANRALIGPDPDLIRVGQHLTITCHNPPATTTVHRWRHARDADGDRPGGAYGHPYRCGDGDGDGWDRPCTAPHHRTPRRTARASVTARYTGSQYSASGLRALWESAGGPAWAAARAARIALCESGGSANAHNSSGASGLWQILGLPFPGNPFDPYVNARMAVAKFRAAGNTFTPWVCQG